MLPSVPASTLFETWIEIGTRGIALSPGLLQSAGKEVALLEGLAVRAQATVKTRTSTIRPSHLLANLAVVRIKDHE